MYAIHKIKTYRVKFKLKVPSAVSYATLNEVENVIVRIDTKDGKTGWGNAAPDPEVTGENIKDVKKIINNIKIRIDKNFEPRDVIMLDKRIKSFAPQFPSARAAINIALFDIIGKNLKKPLCEILGISKIEIPISYTIGLLPVDDALKLTKQALKKGFKILKIKIGESVEQDIERIKKIYEITKGKIKFRLDVNQAYTVEDTLALMRAVKKLPIDFLEQPTPKRSINSLKKIMFKRSIPIMADESVINFLDCLRVCSERCADLINIKLMKCGGISEAIQINTLAQYCEIPTMIGCMDESRISISAGLHFALSQPNTIYADLDGHLDIENDVASGGVKLKDGKLFPVDKPGLGVIVNL